MHLLANENFPSDAVNALRERGHDVIWIRTEAPGSRDEDFLARARKELRVLVAFDKDFGELAFCQAPRILWHYPISNQTAFARVRRPVNG